MVGKTYKCRKCGGTSITTDAMKLFTVGEKIWFLSIILYFVWVIIGAKFEISYSLISLLGSAGMIIFVIICNLLRLINTRRFLNNEIFKNNSVIKRKNRNL